MLDSLAPARRRLFLGVGGVVAAALLVGGVAFGVSAVHGGHTVTPVSQDAQPPVLIVPGYGGGTGGLETLAAALRAHGRDATIVQLAGDGTGDLETQAAVLQRAVQTALGRGAPSVDIVGYSAGGVTARLWFRAYDGGSVARRIVTLGSPQHGTDLAALASDLAPDSCPVACQQLATDSDLIRSLDSGDETPPGPAWVSIWTTDDRISTPPQTASLDGALDLTVQSVCPGRSVTHGQLPEDPAVVAMVLAELARTPPVVPPSSVCAAA
ncbi:lipase family alpha/beta hydrolase [Nocardioides cynanchi]|uniref:lipase family alpha/beta hydrolase n=1 Tax=Nocardioides cynanchi TaxID=2558918 RepID=UPI001244D54C|nr:lipase [Nocardioides cynanchi]